MKQREGSIEAAVRSGNQSSRGNKNKKGKTIKTKHPRRQQQAQPPVVRGTVATRTRRQLRDTTTLSTPSTTVLVRRRTPTDRGRRERRNTTLTLVLGLAIGVFFQFKNNGGFHPHLARSTGVDVRKVPTSPVHYDPPSSTSEPRGSVQFCLERRGTRGRWIQGLGLRPPFFLSQPRVGMAGGDVAPGGPKLYPDTLAALPACHVLPLDR